MAGVEGIRVIGQRGASDAVCRCTSAMDFFVSSLLDQRSAFYGLRAKARTMQIPIQKRRSKYIPGSQAFPRALVISTRRLYHHFAPVPHHESCVTTSPHFAFLVLFPFPFPRPVIRPPYAPLLHRIPAFFVHASQTCHAVRVPSDKMSARATESTSCRWSRGYDYR